MTRPTDTQRQKVYDAEAKFTPWSDKAKVELTVEQAHREAVKAAAWLRTKGLRVTEPTVESIGGRGGSYAEWSGRIGFSKVRPLRWILLHEVAHLVRTGSVPGFADAPDDRSHGAAFCAAYLMLVQHYLGVADAKALKAAMRKTGARYTPKRKRVMTPEAKAELAARLAAHRKPPSPHRFALTRVMDDGTTIYASPRRWDYAHHVDHATRRVDLALTRATEESLRKWAAKEYLVIPGEIEDEWVVTDIAADLAALDLDNRVRVARDLVERAARQVAEAQGTLDHAEQAHAARQAELANLLWPPRLDGQAA